MLNIDLKLLKAICGQINLWKLKNRGGLETMIHSALEVSALTIDPLTLANNVCGIQKYYLLTLFNYISSQVDDSSLNWLPNKNKIFMQ